MKKLVETKRTSRKSDQQRKLRSDSQFEIVEPRAREAQKRTQIGEAQMKLRLNRETQDFKIFKISMRQPVRCTRYVC
jgi:hypothetical protein